MDNIDYTNNDNLTITSSNVPFEISFNKDRSYFMNDLNFKTFIKACERLVRKNPDYIQMVDEIREIHMDHCQVLGNISRYDAELQLHHGPMLTLFDYCMIVLNYYLNSNQTVNTFKVARTVIDEHMAGHVQFVVLCKTVHQLIDSGQIFINLNQAIGNIIPFLTKYKSGITNNMKDKINEYIDLSKKFESNDNNILELEDNMVTWSYRDSKAKVVIKES